MSRQGLLKGTRVMVSVILDNLAAGISPEDIRRAELAIRHKGLQLLQKTRRLF